MNKNKIVAMWQPCLNAMMGSFYGRAVEGETFFITLIEVRINAAFSLGRHNDLLIKALEVQRLPKDFAENSTSKLRF